MLISTCNNVFNAIPLHIGDNVVTIVDHVKDLGVTVDNRLRLNMQFYQTVARAFVRSDLLHKCFASRDTVTIVRAFIVYITANNKVE